MIETLLTTTDQPTPDADRPDAGRVLMVAYNFPPHGGGGVQRTVKFVKYLSELGWQSTVVAPQSEDTAAKCDPTLAEDVPPDTEVLRVGSRTAAEPPWSRLLSNLPFVWRYHNRLRRNLRFPDVGAHWKELALQHVVRRAQQRDIDVLYSTSPPVSSHWVALHAKRQTGLPWVADFRDPWTDGLLYGSDLFAWRKRQDLHFERAICESADCVIANTATNRNTLLNKYGLDPAKVITIPNGYDEDDFASVPDDRPNDVFRISYSGSAYGSYTPAQFACVLQRFLDRRPDARVEWVIAGTACDWATREITAPALASRLSLSGYLAHGDAVKLLKASHLLVQCMPKSSNYWVPGKLYEHIRSGTPTLALCEIPSEVEALVKTTDSGQPFEHDEEVAAADWLEQQYLSWETGQWTGRTPCTPQVEQFERRNLTRRLAQVLAEVQSQHSQSAPAVPKPQPAS